MSEREHIDRPDDAAADDAVADEERPEAERSTAQRVLRVALWAVGGLVALVLVLVVVLLLLLQTDWGASKAGGLIAGLANPYDAAELSIGGIDGNWLSGLELRDVNLVRTDSLTGDAVRMAHVDSLLLSYDLGALFSKKIHVESVGLYGAQISARQNADSTWDLTEPFGESTDTTQSSFSVQVDEIVVQDAGLTAAFYAPGRDSTLRVSDLDTRIGGLFLGPDQTAVDVEDFAMQFTPPGQDVERELAARAALADGRLTVDTLRLDSPFSDLTAQGTLGLPQEGEPAENIDFRLSAQPLDFRDLAGFVPALNPERSLTLDARVTGTGDLLNADVDATFSDGATLNLQAEATPNLEGPVRFTAEGNIDGLNPAFFTADTSAGTINAAFAADLQGEALERISGTASATLTDSRYGAYQINRARLQTDFTDGVAELDFRSDLRGGALTADGTLRPFADPLAYDLRARFANLDLGALTGDTTQASDLTGTLYLDGTGADLASANVTARLDLAPSTLNRYRLEDGQLTAQVADGNVDFSARLDSPQGSVTARGNASDLASGTPRYRISQGRLDSVDVAALTGDTTRSQISGTFSLQGEGASPEALRIDEARLDLADSYYGAYEIDAANLSATLRDERLDATGAVRLQEGGRFDLDATAYPFAVVPRFSARGSFAEVDVGTLAQNPNQASNLAGNFRIEGRGTSLETLDLDANVTLDESQLNQQEIQSAAVDVQLQSGTLNFDVRLDTPEGATRLAGTAQPFGDAPSYTLREGTLRGLNLGALAGIPALQTDLNATVQMNAGTLPPALAGSAQDTASVSASALQRMRLDAQIDVERSTINDATITGGQLVARADSGQARLDGTLAFAEGSAAVEAQADLSGEVPTYRANLNLDNLDLAALAGNDTLSSRLSLTADVEGRGTDPETMTLDAEIASNRITFDDVVVREMAVDLALADGFLRVDTLLVDANVGRITGGGPIALFNTAGPASDFSFTATLDDLSAAESLAGVDILSVDDGQITGRVTGRDTLRFGAEAELTSLIYGDVRLAGLEARTEGALGPDRALEGATARGSLAYLSNPSITVEDIGFDARYADEAVSFETSLLVDEDREATLSGRVDLRPDNQRVELDRFDLRLGQDEWELLQPATIAYGEQYRVSNLLLFTGDQQIAVDGVVDLDGRQSLVMTIENFQIGGVADLADFQGLGGTLNGTLDLTGPAEAPNLAGTLGLDIVSYDEAVGTLRLGIEYDSLRLGFDAQLQHEDGSALTAEGAFPLDLRLTSTAEDSATVTVAPDLLQQQPLQMKLQAEAFDIGWVRPFLDPATVNRIEGKLTADMTLSGTPAAPDLSGQAGLAGGTLGLPDLGVTYNDIRAEIETDGDRLLLQNARLESGDGRLTAEGSLNLANLTLGEYDLTLQADDFLAIDSREYRAAVDANLSVSGTTEKPRIEGGVEVLSADIYLFSGEGETPDLAEVSLDAEARQMLEERFGVRLTEADTATTETYEALALDLDVEIQRDTWLRARANPEMAIQLTGDLDVQKPSGGEPQLFGTIETIAERSYVLQFGRRFNVTEGVVTFNGPATQPILDFRAELPIKSPSNPGQNQVLITLDIEGTPDDLSLTPGSEPQMETADIVSYIATGRPADEAFQLGGSGGGGALGAGTELALGQVANILEGAAGQEFGLDVVEIDVDGLQGATLTAGKYVTQRFYVATELPISRSSANRPGAARGSDTALTQVTLEYELTDWLLARLIGNAENLRVNLFWEYAY